MGVAFPFVVKLVAEVSVEADAEVVVHDEDLCVLFRGLGTR